MKYKNLKCIKRKQTYNIFCKSSLVFSNLFLLAFQLMEQLIFILHVYLTIFSLARKSSWFKGVDFHKHFFWSSMGMLRMGNEIFNMLKKSPAVFASVK